MMMFTIRTARACAAAVLLFSACGGTDQSPRLLPTMGLLDQYETVILSDGGVLSKAGQFSMIPASVVAKLQQPYSELLSILGQGPINLRDLGSVDFVAVGAKNFKSSTELGSVKSDLCFVIRSSLLPSFDFRDRGLEAFDITTDVRIWKMNRGTDGGAVYYASRPSREYLLIGNDRVGLVALTKLLKTPRVERSEAFDSLTKLSFWNEMVKSRYWGYRHYRLDSNIESRQASGALSLGAAVRALSFFINSSSDSAQVDFVFDRNASNIASVLNSIGPYTFMELGGGLWRTNVPLKSVDENDEMMFSLISMFGFGIYL